MHQAFLVSCKNVYTDPQVYYIYNYIYICIYYNYAYNIWSTHDALIVEGRIEYDQFRKSIDVHETRRISFIVAVVSACFSCQILRRELCEQGLSFTSDESNATIGRRCIACPCWFSLLGGVFRKKTLPCCCCILKIGTQPWIPSFCCGRVVFSPAQVAVLDCVIWSYHVIPDSLWSSQSSTFVELP